jgi:kynurenine formamidase
MSSKQSCVNRLPRVGKQWLQEKRRGHQPDSDGEISQLAALPAEFIDLIKDVAPDMPVNPGDAKPIFKYVSTFERDRVDVTSSAMSTHNDAHVGAPKHFIATIDMLPLTRFVGQSVGLDLANVKMGSEIADNDLERIHQR